MMLCNDSTYETRDMLLERVSRQKQTIKAAFEERDSIKDRLKRALENLDAYKAENGILRAQILAANSHSYALALDILQRFRDAVRNQNTGDYIGGANQRRMLADVDKEAETLLLNVRQPFPQRLRSGRRSTGHRATVAIWRTLAAMRQLLRCGGRSTGHRATVAILGHSSGHRATVAIRQTFDRPPGNGRDPGAR